MFLSGLTLGTGMTLARFHITGKTPCCNEVLKIQRTGSARNAKKILVKPIWDCRKTRRLIDFNLAKFLFNKIWHSKQIIW